ncbi:hypothetical protein LJK88_17485 [Paenibacillus sp. P26]|nr:hypothetical protein LJK88_17485 [Paenibacillus sp. P26]
MAVDAEKSTSNFDYLSAATFTGVSLNRSPAFTVNNPPSDTVSVPAYTLMGHMTDGAYVTVTNNGVTVIDSEFIAGDTDFSKTVPLGEGVNTIVVSAKNSDVFGNMVNKKTFTVTYSKIATIITPSEEIPETVSLPVYELKASVNKNAAVTVTLNREKILDSVTKSAYEPFTVSLSLWEGPNEIAVSAVDAYGIGAVNRYRITYQKDWGEGLFTVSPITLTDLNGQVLSGFAASQDLFAGATFHNNSGVGQDGVLVIALYDRDDRMVRYSFLERTVPGGSDQAFKSLVHLPADPAGYKLKAFVWNRMSEKIVTSNVVTNP